MEIGNTIRIAVEANDTHHYKSVRVRVEADFVAEEGEDATQVVRRARKFLGKCAREAATAELAELCNPQR